MGIEKFVFQHCENNKIPKERVEILDWKTFSVDSIDKGVIFVHGPWSGPSVIALQMFFHAMREANPAPNIRIMFLDADNYDSDEFVKIFGSVSHGYGESYWILDGKFIHKDVGIGTGMMKERIIEQFGKMNSSSE